ncbi:MAG: ATP synthase F1 subunit delta [Acidimicrobiales bacterium]|jgi:F-type H+-transporting ATPase subunit delta|nr:ATP synthase F1 subunit delta [Acidimicrobiaceae bacterium]MEC7427103.1 ATP synthase F1 subunit delta [Actinomycetota bacterium]MEC9089270.1 ATP synthase F1 subunit delta [Actinomycetota bacterium]HAE55539.1 ATP synthase F1 subunit delta [Acidimicrobiaceae bacterium]HAQ43167.1 ATP synthase F1 subunit delta [Acidimicrobiaceae bacterium]|tara:strand:+ start:70333 stop:70860 length:528 start_codon:yes stop_codon:yes gene_type:complete
MTEKVEEYAAGLAKLAEAEGELNRVADELYQLGRTVESSDQLRSTLSDRTIPASRRIGILEDLLGASASPVTINLVSMLVGAGRGSHIGPIADELIRQAAESRGQAVAEVRSAVTLNDDQRGRLKSALSSATGMNIDIVVVVDPEILGGVVAQVGDTVFDGSVRTRLEKMKERLS